MKEKQKEIDEISRNKFNSSIVNAGSRKHNKTLLKIQQIIENYTEKCKITSIRVDECSRKLIIQSRDRLSDDERPLNIKPLDVTKQNEITTADESFSDSRQRESEQSTTDQNNCEINNLI